MLGTFTCFLLDNKTNENYLSFFIFMEVFILYFFMSKFIYLFLYMYFWNLLSQMIHFYINQTKTLYIHLS